MDPRAAGPVESLAQIDTLSIKADRRTLNKVLLPEKWLFDTMRPPVNAFAVNTLCQHYSALAVYRISIWMDGSRYSNRHSKGSWGFWDSYTHLYRYISYGTAMQTHTDVHVHTLAHQP